MRHTHPGYNRKEQGFAVCKQQGLLKKGEKETNARVLKKFKKNSRRPLKNVAKPIQIR